jgi:hypothetical protein
MRARRRANANLASPHFNLIRPATELVTGEWFGLLKLRPLAAIHNNNFHHVGTLIRHAHNQRNHSGHAGLAFMI